ncbi:hypothetical protein AAG570_013504 [Ranatra chinensis]|uniref:Uncharacterized protein n=1 Tax=Ranatra chinensis TaxID=642074 RepID=A0ABD0YCC8_9HEMI
MRGEPWRRNIETSSGHVSEVYLGSCLCDELRSKSFCSKSLEAARPEDCFFGDPNRGDYNYTRVHRRLCDLSIMGKYPLCSCKQTMDSRPFRRVRGFPTCYQWPIENWLCERHSVCGVAACSTSTLPSGLVSVQCHNKCIHNQPFCESKPISGSSSSPRVVTSVWSDWACLKPTSMNLNDEDSTGEVVQVCQSTCQDPKRLYTIVFSYIYLQN